MPAMEPKPRGGRPPQFGLGSTRDSKRQLKAKRKTGDEIKTVPEQINSRDVEVKSNTCCEYDGELYFYKYSKEKETIRVYQRKECKNCKLYYHKKKKEWQAEIDHIEDCTNK